MGFGTLPTDPVAAGSHFEASITAIDEAAGSETSWRTSPWVIASLRVGMGLVAMQRHDRDGAVPWFEEAERLSRGRAPQFLFVPIGLLGLVASLRGDLAEARRRAAEVLEAGRASGGHLAIAMGLDLFADLALRLGRPDNAAVLAAARAKLSDEAGGTPSSALSGVPDSLDAAREALHDDERFDAAVARGRSMPPDEAIEMALSLPTAG
jgi:hypothetical protein